VEVSMRTALFFLLLLLVPATAGPHGAVPERLLLDNARMTVTEYTFPPGFKGEIHAAVADELAYVVDGEFTVLMLGPDRKVVKRVLRVGEVDYAEKGTLHSSHNVSDRPARVVVVLLKGPTINRGLRSD
jgi:quercetin dioxygenase-like cupin family protein